jgi:hypothetical protein
MGYFKTAEDVQAFQTGLQGMQYDVEATEVAFTTTRDFLGEVLPPCFEVPDDPQCVVEFVSADGRGRKFYAVTIYVSAKFGDILGWYDLTMLLTGDMTVTLGRELWGESKKRAKIAYESGLPNVRGYAERNGTRLIEIEGSDLGSDLGPRTSQRTCLHLKAFLNTDATDLEWDPIVFALSSTTKHHTYYEGTGTLRLQSTEADPCGTIPIVSVDKVTYGTSSVTYEHAQYQLPDRAGFLPYVIGRSYDLSHAE